MLLKLIKLLQLLGYLSAHMFSALDLVYAATERRLSVSIAVLVSTKTMYIIKTIVSRD